MGKKGGDKPTDNEVERMQVFGPLVKPLESAIGEARWLHENNPFQSLGFNQQQREALNQTYGIARNQAGQLGGAVDFAQGLAAGGGIGGPANAWMRNQMQALGAAGQGNMQGGVAGLNSAVGGIGAGMQDTARGTNALAAMLGGEMGGALGGAGDAYQQQFLANGAPTAGAAQLRQLAGQAAGGSGGLDMLRSTAGGGMLGGNPYLDSTIAAMNRGTTEAFRDANAGLEGRLAMSGRFSGDPTETEMAGRDRLQRNLATGLAENEARVRYGDYASERGLQQQAQLALPGAFSTEIGTGVNAANALAGNALARSGMELGAASGLSGLGRADTAQRAGIAQGLAGLGISQTGQGLGAAGQLGQLGLGQTGLGANLAQGLNQNTLAGQQQALAAGGALAGLQQAQLAPWQTAFNMAELERQVSQSQANAPWNALNQYANTLQGLSGMANPAAAQAGLANYQSSGQQRFGGALGAAGLGAQIGGPWGALAGAGLGFLFG